MRPDFGCGLLDLVFTPNSPELASALELSVQASLQRWLGELIAVESLDVVSEENVVRVHLSLRRPLHREPARRGLRREGRGMSARSELVCRTDGRRAKVREARLGGVDTVEVADDGLTLTVTFLGKAPHGLCPENVRIDGGRRVTGIEAVEVSVEREEDPELDDRLYVTLDRTGDTPRPPPSRPRPATGSPSSTPTLRQARNRAVPRLRPAVLLGGVRLPGRLPHPVRLQGRAARLPAGHRGRTGRRLHRPRLRDHPQADPRPAGAHHA